MQRRARVDYASPERPLSSRRREPFSARLRPRSAINRPKPNLNLLTSRFPHTSRSFRASTSFSARVPTQPESSRRRRSWNASRVALRSCPTARSPPFLRRRRRSKSKLQAPIQAIKPKNRRRQARFEGVLPTFAPRRRSRPAGENDCSRVPASVASRPSATFAVVPRQTENRRQQARFDGALPTF